MIFSVEPKCGFVLLYRVRIFFAGLARSVVSERLSYDHLVRWAGRRCPLFAPKAVIRLQER
jgi:hypothetical protein